MLKKQKKISFLHWIVVLIFFGAVSLLVGKNATDFQASVIPTQQAAPYNGTVLPIQKAPDWVNLSSAEWNMSYDQLSPEKLLPIPTYDPLQLKIPTEQLTWTTADKTIRNAKITFSTPYMGNYKLDGVEYGGSHLAVDIKVPNSTPVYSIGNGVVTKVSNQVSGFGYHIVIQHDNFPSFADANIKTTYYSTYSHLGNILISEGNVVTKGQQIGITGQSGSATTPHLHYQIDNIEAPWHPYWPFTYSEALAVGLDFTGAVNAGLGQAQAIATTINPMLYVQKYLNETGIGFTTLPTPPPTAIVSSSSTVAPNSSNGSSSDLPPAIDNSADIHSSSSGTTSDSSSLPANIIPPIRAAGFKLTADGSFVVGASEIFTLEAIDLNGNTVRDFQSNNGVNLTVENGSANILKNYLTTKDFHNGLATFSVIPTAKHGLRIKAGDGIITGSSEIMQSAIFTDISADAEIYKALNFLKNHEVISGYPDGSFQPKKAVSRVEALKFIVKGSTRLKLEKTADLPFKDILLDQWYVSYLATAYKNKIVKGYQDLTFKPSQVVTKAEFLKMLLAAMDVNLPRRVAKDVFDDVKKNAWYAPYVEYAKNKNLIATNSNLFKPEEGMQRDEVAELIYRTVVLQLSGEQQFKSGLVVSGTQAQEYFAGKSS